MMMNLTKAAGNAISQFFMDGYKMIRRLIGQPARGPWVNHDPAEADVSERLGSLLEHNIGQAFANFHATDELD